MWRSAKTEDSERIVEMCRNLNIEDPSEDSRSGEMFVRRTLVELSANPVRGQAVVLEYDGMVCGYALLISYWSNEFGGEICSIDELFVEPSLRGKGFATLPDYNHHKIICGLRGWWRSWWKPIALTRVRGIFMKGAAFRSTPITI